MVPFFLHSCEIKIIFRFVWGWFVGTGLTGLRFFSIHHRSFRYSVFMSPLMACSWPYYVNQITLSMLSSVNSRRSSRWQNRLPLQVYLKDWKSSLNLNSVHLSFLRSATLAASPTSLTRCFHTPENCRWPDGQQYSTAYAVNWISRLFLRIVTHEQLKD